MRTPHTTTILVLLVFAVGINYIDRGSLPVAEPEVAKEFQIDAVQMGWLLSAFFWSYSICHVLAGWLVDRFDVKWIYAVGFLIWSLATLAMGLVDGAAVVSSLSPLLGSWTDSLPPASAHFAVFFILRLILGVGESVAYPATSRIIVANFDENRRGLANALVDAASKIGPFLSMLLGGLMIARWGWRSLFITMGLLSLIWLIPWWVLVPAQESSEVSAESSAAQVGFCRILGQCSFWGTALGFFCLGYTWYFIINWLPSYLQNERGFTKEQMAIFGSLPLLAMAGTSMTGGWLSDRWISRGASPTLVRKGFLIGGFGLCAAFLYASMQTANPRWCIGLLIVACASLGFFTSNAWAVTQSIAGAAAAGRWSGAKNAIGNMGGVASSLATGWIYKETKSFGTAFTVASLMLVVGVFAYAVLVGPVRPVNWDDSTGPEN